MGEEEAAEIMRVWIEGEKSRAACHECKEVVSTTMRRRDVAVAGTPMTVPNLMAGVCDRCGSVVSITPQSTPDIRRALDGAHAA